ncbi:condensation domain-containing protein [Mycobacterium decipiens]|uniref:Acyltransferase n=1 Tax=Mycobacterium decipiens TaxID=1430326 RepID=A0A1X2LSG7_9MYCO|nr:condensation domain-containing protein [Mycobacterium decipiens]OSC38954.1 acyltransferase [Mycobacterium decipiens]
MVALGTINDWLPPHGLVTTWMASPAARAAARSARRSQLAPSYQRARHLSSSYQSQVLNREQPRLMVVAWDLPGVCDIPAMTAAINLHVRRHDAYHDWFELDNEVFVRRTIDDPADIDLIPASFGYMSAQQLRAHALTTPATLNWDCFTFGIIQHPSYFTCYASVDQLHVDDISASLIFLDICGMYRGQPQVAALSRTASYRDYAARQRDKVASLTLSSPEIKDWIEFARATNGDWPGFPLPLGDTSASNRGDFLTVELLDAAETQAFDTACRAAGARFSGGVLACAALVERELTGTQTYHGFTPRDTRTPAIDTTTVGCFANLVPITVPIGGGSFPETARAAQHSYDTAKHLANVPFERVLELATPEQLGITVRRPPAMRVSFLDLRKIPDAAGWDKTNFGVYSDNLSNGGINLWINRHAEKTTMTISFPNNPDARMSVCRYTVTLIETFARVVKDTSAQVTAQADSSELSAS